MEKEKSKPVKPALPCPHAKKCGGCQLQNMDYPQQLAWKENRVRRLIGCFGPVQPILGMESPYHYRNKVQAAFGLGGRRRIISGVYQSSSHRIVPVDRCMIEDKTADKIIVTIRGLMPSFHMLAYDERTGTGFLRHVLVKRGFATGQVMVVLVAASPIFKLQKPFVKKLLDLHPEITTIVLNINDKFTPLVLGQREKVLYGKGYIEDVLCGKTFRISPRSFYQVNPVQTEVLYSTAIALAGLTGQETVLDAYCGTGTIALIASDSARKVLGVELNRDAVRDAIANARQNGVTNCWFTAADAGEYMDDMAAHHDRPDVVFMDPPRAGSDEKFLRSLLRLSPPKVIYISCNPETLARDLKTLCPGGYKLETAQPVDMFPWTGHVETICALSLEK
ncbi:MAG: 23S rRNA (uracil(1939)-C(5))-methyltransferase RlmD [Oscillospiraceae bacterium]|nr:23S rRNA (uracil(1939)-C(5))-methyltransferase RlmD [Oscillospiraceae bacterium]